MHRPWVYRTELCAQVSERDATIIQQQQVWPHCCVKFSEVQRGKPCHAHAAVHDRASAHARCGLGHRGGKCWALSVLVEFSELPFHPAECSEYPLQLLCTIVLKRLPRLWKFCVNFVSKQNEAAKDKNTDEKVRPTLMLHRWALRSADSTRLLSQCRPQRGCLFHVACATAYCCTACNMLRVASNSHRASLAYSLRCCRACSTRRSRCVRSRSTSRRWLTSLRRRSASGSPPCMAAVRSAQRSTGWSTASARRRVWWYTAPHFAVLALPCSAAQRRTTRGRIYNRCCRAQ